MGKICVSGLGKAYKTYHSHWARLAEWLLPYRSLHTNKWVLQDISFTVKPGEALGIIGLNGAGKSTLLKLITGTTQATTGKIEISGRVAAMLELGMGFHPDFTGRQNVYMAGQLLGIPSRDIERLMPDIEAFAEIGEYLDMPIRVFSSGMQMRLAFSVATAVRPDVLIVDEALSVGDAYFQHKSFDRIRHFRAQGTTLLIVSHDKSSIQSICDRAILLNHGQIALEGTPESVMDYYNAMLASHQNQGLQQLVQADGKTQTVSGTGEATVVDVAMIDQQGERIEVVDVGQSLTLRIVVKVNQNIPRLILGYSIKDRLGQVVFGTNTDLTDQPLNNVTVGTRLRFDIDFPANLGPGSYSVQTALVSTDTHLVNNYEWRDRAMIFEVINLTKSDFAGCAWIPPLIKIQTL
jgi:lipopolysaccharide transport system ATP-binding protein